MTENSAIENQDLKTSTQETVPVKDRQDLVEFYNKKSIPK